jgi:hypothetical protein
MLRVRGYHHSAVDGCAPPEFQVPNWSLEPCGMNSMTMSGASSSRCSPTSRVAYRGWGCLRGKSCPWVSFSWSMETVGEPYGLYLKLLIWKHFVSSVPKSLGQRVLRKIRSPEHFPAVCPPTRSTAASLKHRRCWPFPARQLGLRIVAIEEIGGPKATTEKQALHLSSGIC